MMMLSVARKKTALKSALLILGLGGYACSNQNQETKVKADSSSAEDSGLTELSGERVHLGKLTITQMSDVVFIDAGVKKVTNGDRSHCEFVPPVVAPNAAATVRRTVSDTWNPFQIYWGTRGAQNIASLNSTFGNGDVIDTSRPILGERINGFEALTAENLSYVDVTNVRALDPARQDITAKIVGQSSYLTFSANLLVQARLNAEGSCDAKIYYCQGGCEGADRAPIMSRFQPWNTLTLTPALLQRNRSVDFGFQRFQ